MIPADSPFHPDNEAGYRAWRAAKLAGYPTRGEDLVVPVRDPEQLDDAEYAALWRLIAKTNMAIYATGMGESEDKEGPRRLSAQFGLTRLDANWLADEDGISSLTPQDEDAEGARRGEFIQDEHAARQHLEVLLRPRVTMGKRAPGFVQGAEFLSGARKIILETTHFQAVG